jgi:cytochrome P450
MSPITQQPQTSPDYHGFEPFKLSDPFDACKELREEAPVMFDDRIGYYVVSRYADIKATFDNWEAFSSAKANAEAPVKPLSAAAKKVMDDGGFTTYSGLSARVPPEHTRIRSVATKAFTGSTEAGQIIAEQCGRLLRPVTLELGGKSAGIRSST